MSVRFTEENWNRFFSANKKTTIRVHELKTGLQAAIGGSRFKPVTFGKVYVHPFAVKRRVHQLDSLDAYNDGFASLASLLLELGRLNKTINADTIVFIHPIEVREGVPRMIKRVEVSKDRGADE